MLFALCRVDAVTFTSDTSIGVTDTTYDGDSLIVDNAVLTIDGVHQFQSIDLINGATLTHSEGVSGVHLTVTDVAISADSSIDVSGKGAAYDSNAIPAYVGASYGGLGGLNNVNDSTNSVYGDLRQPVDLGTSGSFNRGGGSLRLTVSNVLNLSGTIKADGLNEYPHNSGGSGGSLWLEVNEVTGIGTISANGSKASSSSGGGGRVAVYYDTLNGFNLTSQVQAFGGYVRVPPNKNHHNGGAGTIYLKDNAAPLGEIIIANDVDWIEGAASPLETPTSGVIVEPITIKHARVDIGSSVSNLLSITAEDSVINQPHDLVIDSLILTNDSHWVQGGELTVNNTYDIQNSSVDHQASFTIPETTPYVISNGAHEVLNAVHPAWTEISVESGAHLQINVNQPQLIDLSIDSAEVEINVPQTLTNLDLSNGAILTHGQGVSGVHLTVTDVTISADSSIDVSGKGAAYDSNIIPAYVGASYGGLGGVDNTSKSSNPTYGDLRQPVELGTSGNYNRGGGSIRLTVSNILNLAGSIKADGLNEYPHNSGGSGGSIWLEVNEVTGIGTINANGSKASSSSGGGGRVAVYYDTLNGFNLTSQVQAFGGYVRVPPSKDHHNGGAGTIYLKNNAEPLGEIIIANDVDWIEGAATPLETPASGAIVEPITIKHARVDIDSSVSN
ncbi:hypothetical protein, partial [Marinicella pacifica]